MDIELDFRWTDGARSCLCCDGYSNEYELEITGNSIDSLTFRLIHTYTHLEELPNAGGNQYNNDNYETLTEENTDVYTVATMAVVFAKIRDMNIDNDETRDATSIHKT